MDTQTILKKTKEYTLMVDGMQHNDEMDVYAKAEGVYIYDVDGKRYLDLASQFINVNIGYGNQKVADAVIKQMQEIHYIKPPVSSEIRVRLCEKIIRDIAPEGMQKIFLTCGGSDANEYAIRIAKIVTGKAKILSQRYSYHGSTTGAALLSEERHRGRLQSNDFIHFFGYTSEDLKEYVSDEAGYDALLLKLLEETILTEDPATVAALFLEPMKLGCLPSPRYMKGVRSICDRYGILLILDEVMVGFGRTGKWFACQHYGIRADILTFAKGVTSSYIPLGGIMVSREVAEKLEYAYFPDGLTASYHPVACAAALATIDYMQENGVVEHTAKVGKYLRENLEKALTDYVFVQEVRGEGLLLTIHMKGKMAACSAVNALCICLKEYGYLTWTDWPTIIVAPPLILSYEQADQIVKDIKRMFDELQVENYLASIRFYPDKSWNMSPFYTPSFLRELTSAMQEVKAKQVLVLGSANAYMLWHVMAAVKGIGCNITFMSNREMYFRMNDFGAMDDLVENENCILFEPLRFEADKLQEQIAMIREMEEYDVVVVPYGREDNDYKNILEIASMFSDHIYLVNRKAEIYDLSYGKRE